ncbi:hypothetical protein RvY_00641 [Ramazzottius varieornatus]|uniref:Uncharacterized protein n=1 Tax=Ramazzottius varieornatus TaxID=947166 RepID=A0A1D1UHJ1_RAMVA|nr:hypothetical protein RvY_00641 [Ramazzottius varieornatus]
MSSRTTVGGKNVGRPTNFRPGSGASGPSSGRFNDRRTTVVLQNQKSIRFSKEDDMRIIQELETIARELEAGSGVHSDIKLSIQELDKPQDSRRIFSANGVVPTLICNASCLSVEELYNRLLTEASNVFSDIRLHLKFGSTTGLAACIKVFLDLFEIQGIDITVSDIQNPNATKIRMLLTQLIGIVGTTSQYEQTLQDYFSGLKALDQRKSTLWEGEAELDMRERDHATKVEREKPEIDRLKETLAQKEEEERAWAAKVAVMHDTAEKTLEKRRMLEQRVINGRNDTVVLKNKLESMQQQIVVDPESIIKKLKEVEEEKAQKDAERNKAYEKYKGLAQWESQSLLKDMEDTLEMFAAAQKKDHKELLALEKEFRSIESDLARSRDDLSTKEKDFKRAMDSLKELEEKKINMRDEVAQEKKRQQQRIKELEKETRDMEKEVEKIRLNTEKLQIATTKKEEEVAALKAQREKWKEDYFAILAAHNMACEAATSEVMEKKAQCDERVRAQKEWHRKTFGYDVENRPQPDANGKVSISKILPSNLVPIYKAASELKSQKINGRWTVPDSVKASIAAMEHPLSEEPVHEQAVDSDERSESQTEPSSSQSESR